MLGGKEVGAVRFAKERRPFDSLQGRKQKGNIQSFTESLEVHDPVRNPQLSALRDQIARIESGGKRACGVLPFGIETVDRKVPGGTNALAQSFPRRGWR